MSTRPLNLRRTTFAGAFAVQMRVIGALIMRELHTRYGRENIGYLWMILEPTLLASGVAIIHVGSGSHYGSDIRPVPFTVIGYGIFIIFRGIFTRAEGTIESNMPLLYHRMVTVLDMLVARTVLEAAGVIGTIALLLGTATAFDAASLPYRPLWLFAAIGYMIWFAFSASAICCAGTHDNRLVARLVHPFTYLLMPISGAFYMLSWVPEPYRSILQYVPLVQIFEMARYGQFASSPSTYFSVLYLTAVCTVMTFFGLLAISVIRKHIHLS